MRGRASTARVVVVAGEHAGTIVDCLDGVAAACPPDAEVWVVDRGGGDGTADLAIRHCRVDRVVPITAHPQQVLELGGKQARRIVVLDAAVRPEPGWYDAAVGALDETAVVLGPDRSWTNMAVDLTKLRDVRLLAGDGPDATDELLRRARAAGVEGAVADDMRTAPACPAAPRPHLLPPTRPPVPGPRQPGLVTVVVCTRDRPLQLARCLRSLERVRDDDHEVLVVDNHATPTVDPGALPPGARLVHEPRRGLDVARNRGTVEAAGDVIAYIDDDCEADPHWLDALRAALADPDVGAVTGRVRPAHLTLPTERAFEAAFSFDRGPERRRFTPWDDRPWYPLWAGPVGTGCNMAFRWETLVDVGGFDELLDVGSSIGGGGDLDAFARLLDRGVLVEYAPDALVWHHHRRNQEALEEQFRGYGESVGALLMKAVLDRPGLRVTAVRYFGERLANGLRLERDARDGASVVTVPLARTFLRGQLRGPARYVRARAAARLP